MGCCSQIMEHFLCLLFFPRMIFSPSASGSRKSLGMFVRPIFPALIAYLIRLTSEERYGWMSSKHKPTEMCPKSETPVLTDWRI